MRLTWRRTVLRKYKKCLKEHVRFITCYEKKKIATFCSAKDNISIHQKANVIYKVTCPGCVIKITLEKLIAI